MFRQQTQRRMWSRTVNFGRGGGEVQSPPSHPWGWYLHWNIWEKKQNRLTHASSPWGRKFLPAPHPLPPLLPPGEGRIYTCLMWRRELLSLEPPLPRVNLYMCHSVSGGGPLCFCRCRVVEDSVTRLGGAYHQACQVALSPALLPPMNDNCAS